MTLSELLYQFFIKSLFEWSINVDEIPYSDKKTITPVIMDLARSSSEKQNFDILFDHCFRYWSQFEKLQLADDLINFLANVGNLNGDIIVACEKYFEACMLGCDIDGTPKIDVLDFIKLYRHALEKTLNVSMVPYVYSSKVVRLKKEIFDSGCKIELVEQLCRRVFVTDRVGSKYHLAMLAYDLKQTDIGLRDRVLDMIGSL